MLIPALSIYRDPRYFFPSPDTFLPERWLKDVSPHSLSDPNKRHVEDAFFPFSRGTMNCVGKPIAYKEIRAVVCEVLRAFEMSAVGEDGNLDEKRWAEGIKEHTIAVAPPLWVRLKKRA